MTSFRSETLCAPVAFATATSGRYVRVVAGALERGWPGPEGGRIRCARPGEADTVARLLGHSGVELEPGMADHIDARTAGWVLDAALADDRDALRCAGDALLRQPDPLPLLFSVSVPLLATDRAGEAVGALVALAPVGVIGDMLSAGWPETAIPGVATTLTKVASVGVDPQARGRGVGRALLGRCAQLYFGAGYTMVFGQFRVERRLAAFYERCSYVVLDEEDTVPVSVAGGVVDLGTDPGQRLFYRRRRR